MDLARSLRGLEEFHEFLSCHAHSVQNIFQRATFYRIPHYDCDGLPLLVPEQHVCSALELRWMIADLLQSVCDFLPAKVRWKFRQLQSLSYIYQVGRQPCFPVLEEQA